MRALRLIEEFVYSITYLALVILCSACYLFRADRAFDRISAMADNLEMFCRKRCER